MIKTMYNVTFEEFDIIQIELAGKLFSKNKNYKVDRNTELIDGIVCSTVIFTHGSNYVVLIFYYNTKNKTLQHLLDCVSDTHDTQFTIEYKERFVRIYNSYTRILSHAILEEVVCA